MPPRPARRIGMATRTAAPNVPLEVTSGLLVVPRATDKRKRTRTAARMNLPLPGSRLVVATGSGRVGPDPPVTSGVAGAVMPAPVRAGRDPPDERPLPPLP